MRAWKTPRYILYICIYVYMLKFQKEWWHCYTYMNKHLRKEGIFRIETRCFDWLVRINILKCISFQRTEGIFYFFVGRLNVESINIVKWNVFDVALLDLSCNIMKDIFKYYLSASGLAFCIKIGDRDCFLLILFVVFCILGESMNKFRAPMTLCG